MRAWIAAAALTALAACNLEPPPERGAQTEPAPATAPPAPLAPPMEAGAIAGRLTARGAAPEWRLTIDPEAGLTLEDIAQGLIVKADYAAPVIAADGRARIGAGAVQVTLENAVCAIGAESGIPWTASVQVEGGDSYRGCAYRRWDNALLDLIPAIDACLAVQPQRAPVAYAGREADGRVLVRLGLLQNRIDCRAPAGAGPVINAPADETLQIASQFDPVFYRAPGENPGGECYAAPEVRAPNGALLGWTDDNAGC
ncbi:MAG: hypothetical protein NW203_04800 [Hyphomonadaceae bacterium]|nr:hypothetical protein [Hyphomonadaceae bacterium]